MATADAHRMDAMDAGWWIGRTVGKYRILGKLRFCGGDPIFLASAGQRHDPGGLVALRLIPPRTVSNGFLHRFHEELHFLGALEHANMQHILGGGISDEGMPYVAMEHVRGVPVHHYCDQKQLTVPERLRLLLPVCSALQTAHEHLLAHRFLDVDSILVDHAHRPRLVDFHIPGHRGLSPRQGPAGNARLGSILSVLPAPDTPSRLHVRGDIAALGSILYQLLTGHRPFATRHDVRQFVRQGPPPRPSRVVEEAAFDNEQRQVTPESIAKRRRTRPSRLIKTLRGDLDRILLKALRQPPGDCYAGVSQLADDLERFLADQPTSVHRPTLTGRLRRLMRRRPSTDPAVT